MKNKALLALRLCCLIFIVYVSPSIGSDYVDFFHRAKMMEGTRECAMWGTAGLIVSIDISPDQKASGRYYIIGRPEKVRTFSEKVKKDSLGRPSINFRDIYNASVIITLVDNDNLEFGYFPRIYNYITRDCKRIR